MPSVTRRGLLALSALLPLARALPAGGCEVPAAAPATGPFAPPVSGREMMRRRYFPDVVLTDHEGRRVRFYEDLLRDRIVVLNLMYANCQGVCPMITANLARVQKILIEQGKRNVRFYSLTVKPEEDTPEALRAYAAMHRVGPGWQFLTGPPADVELLRSKLGFVDLDPQVDRNDPASHSGMVRFGNEPQAWWAACQGQANPEWMAREISFVIPAETPRRPLV
jgi:protein SCO1/2